MLRFVLIFAALLLSSAANAQDGGPSKYWFGVDAVNPVLGQPPASVDRETPQATLESFLFSTSDEDYDAAAHLLDLRDVPQNIAAAVAPELARKLRTILDRRVWVSWGALPDRPDGLSIGDGPMGGEPRRSIRMAVIDLDGRPVPIRINRIKPENGEPAWLFSRQSVENIDALYRLYGPSPVERMMPVGLRTNVMLGLEVWELLVLPLLLIAAAFAGIGTYRLIGRFTDDGDDENETWVETVTRATQLPIALAVGATVCWLFLEYVVSFNGAVNLFLDPLIASILVLAGAMLVVRVIDGLLSMAIRRNTDDIETAEGRKDRDFYTNISGARRLATVIVLLFGIGLVLSQTNTLKNLGFTALGGASVLTLILAFAGRAVLSNIMSSLQIAFSKPARIGDTLIFQGRWVTVKRIHFTYVELEVWDGRLLIVPVNEFVSESFENLTKHNAELIRTIYLVLDHRAPVDRLRDAFTAFVEGDERVADMESTSLDVIKHDRDGIHCRFKVNTLGPQAGWELALEAREHLLNVARDMEKMTGKPILPVERELQIESERDGLAS